jgi:hypothetical protein
MSIEDDEIQIDEELEEIDYYELVSIEEIIKVNPDFIAFSKEDIYNEIFNFVKNKSKTSIFLKLFYEIINKKPNVNNFIILTDAIRGEYESLDIADFINSIKKYNKLNNIELATSSKNKLWFPLTYNMDDTKLRFNANQKTVLELSKDNNFIVYKDDETNIPILGVYYYTPITVLDDYLNLKVMSHLYKPEKLQELKSDKYDNFEDMIKDYKIKLPINKIDKDDYNYVSINNILLKYNYNFDNINLNDLNEIKKYLIQLNKSEKAEKVNYKKVEIKGVEIVYNRNNFFKALSGIKKLIETTFSSLSTITSTLKNLETQKKSLNYKELAIAKDLFSIINNINDKNYDEIIENLRNLRTKINLDNAIEKYTIYSKMNKKEIINELEELEKRFELVSFVFTDIYKLNFDFSNEEHEIEKGLDEKNYSGIPLKIVNYEEKEDKFEYNEDKISKDDNDKNKFDKYFNNQIYNNEKGFIELLKLVFPFISNMETKSGLSINYDIITNLLFNKFRIIETKATIIKKYIPDIIESDLELILSRPMKQILIKNDKNDLIFKAINEYFNNFKNVIYEIIAYWSLNIQKEIIYNTLIINYENMSVECEYLWDNYGSPYDLKAEKGVLIYLFCIFQSVYDELFLEKVDIVKIDKNDYKKRIVDIIINDYSKELREMEKVKVNEDKKINLGRVHYDNLYKLLANRDYKNPNFLKYYVEALIYMPSIKFQKIHKYLNGCCLEKIDENFSADLYFKNERQDLKKAKEKLSSNRVFNTPRSKRFYIRKDKKIEKVIKFNKIENPITTEIYMNDIQQWLKNLNNNHTVFTKDLIANLIKSNVKTVENYKDLYLNYFYNKDLKLLLLKNNFNNYKQLALNVSKILFKYLSETHSLKMIEIINNTIFELDKLNSIITDDNFNEIINIRRIAVIRILSLPAIPEAAINKKLNPSIQIDTDIYNEIFKEIISKTISIINNSKMLDLEEQINFINKNREDNKFKLLAKLNKKSLEEKNIEKEMKKYGISYDDEDDDEDIEKVVNNNKPNDDDIEREGEDEYELEVEDDEGDDEYMATANYGFIYS